MFNRQFIFRMRPDLPFYVWSLNSRFKLDEEDDFDKPPQDVNPETEYIPRLHRLTRRTRDDATIIAGGKSVTPAQHSSKIRQRWHRFDIGVINVPSEVESNIRHIRDKPFVVT